MNEQSFELKAKEYCRKKYGHENIEICSPFQGKIQVIAHSETGVSFFFMNENGDLL